MEEAVSFYELMRGVQGIKDLVEFQQACEKKVNVSKQNVRVLQLKEGPRLAQFCLFSYCKKQTVTPRVIVSCLKEIGEECLASDLEAYYSASSSK